MDNPKGSAAAFRAHGSRWRDKAAIAGSEAERAACLAKARSYDLRAEEALRRAPGQMAMHDSATKILDKIGHIKKHAGELLHFVVSHMTTMPEYSRMPAPAIRQEAEAWVHKIFAAADGVGFNCLGFGGEHREWDH